MFLSKKCFEKNVIIEQEKRFFRSLTSDTRSSIVKSFDYFFKVKFIFLKRFYQREVNLNEKRIHFFKMFQYNDPNHSDFVCCFVMSLELTESTL